MSVMETSKCAKTLMSVRRSRLAANRLSITHETPRKAWLRIADHRRYGLNDPAEAHRPRQGLDKLNRQVGGSLGLDKLDR